MDPQACLERLIHAYQVDEMDEVVQAAGDLLVWLLKGGSLPKAGTLDCELIALAIAKAADQLE